MFNLIAGTLQKTGVFGVLILMLVENLVPLIPSELIMPMAGYEAAKGSLDPYLTVLAGAVGSIIGGVFWYRLGYALWSRARDTLGGAAWSVGHSDGQGCRQWYGLV